MEPQQIFDTPNIASFLHEAIEFPVEIEDTNYYYNKQAFPFDLLVYILTYLDINELLLSSGVSKLWYSAVYFKKEICWKEIFKTKWSFGKNEDINQFGSNNYRYKVITRVLLDQWLDKKSINMDNIYNLWLQKAFDNRCLDWLFRYFQIDLDTNKYMSTYSTSLLIILFGFLMSNSLLDVPLHISVISNNNNLDLPVVFSGSFTQLFTFDLNPIHPSYSNCSCRSEWSFAIIIEPSTNPQSINNSAWPFSMCPFIRKALPNNNRQSVKAFCCWKKKSQISHPSLQEIESYEYNHNIQPNVSSWLTNLYKSLNKPTISVAEGFYQPHNELLLLSATGETLIREDDNYPNVPGRVGNVVLYLDEQQQQAKGLFSLDLDLSNIEKGQGFYFLNRISIDEWKSSELFNALPSLPKNNNNNNNFPYYSSLLPQKQ